MTDAAEEAKPDGLSELAAVFARIGCLSFGGPAGQIAMMHKTLVEERRWISEARFLHALNYCMLLPGPEAQQLATYIGWLLYGTRGGAIAGLLFVVPGLAVMIALACIYCLYHHAGWLAGMFFGMKAAVLAIVAQAMVRLARKTLTTPSLKLVAALAFVALFCFRLPFPLVVLAAGLTGWAAGRGGSLTDGPAVISAMTIERPPAFKALATLIVWVAIWQLPLALLWLSSAPQAFTDLFVFFSKMAMVTFGGAYAVLAYVAQVAVETYDWLRPGEMIDGLALAETTPGPLVLVLSFVGFLVGFREAAGMGAVTGGILGAWLVAWATFVPSFIFIFAGAPYIERLRGNRMLSGALSAITAAVVGVILNLAIWFGLHVLFREVRWLELFAQSGVGILVPDIASLDRPALLLFLASAFLLFRTRLGMVAVLAVCAGAGVLLQLVKLT